MEFFLHSRPERPDLTVRASSFDHVREFLGSHDPTEPKAPESCDPCTLFSTSPQSFWALRFNRTLSTHEPCGSRASSPALRSSVSTARPNRRTVGPCGPYVLIRLRREVFGASRPAESKAPRSADPCPLFSTSPQNFWALRFNRTLSAREPCGSRTSPPAP